MSVSFFLVEDHPLMRRGVTAFLEGKSGLECRGVAGGREELLALAHGGRTADVLVADLNLGGSPAEGLALIRESRGSFPAMEVVAYSMHTAPGIVVAAREAGAKGYVSKESEDSVLLEAVLAAARGEPYLDASLAERTRGYEQLVGLFSRSEKKVLDLVLKDKRNEEIARELGISRRTVENYLSHIYDKTGLYSRADLARTFAGRQG